MKFERLINPLQFKTFKEEIKTVLKYCLENKKRVHILIEPEVKKRSTGPGSQSNHLNGHIQQLSELSGQPFEDIKKYIKQQAISMGYPMEKRFGNPFLDLWGNPFGISETECTSKQCAMLIEQTHILAAENGWILVENEHDWQY